MFHRTKSLRLTAATGVVALAAAGLVGFTTSASAAEPDKPGPNNASSSSAPARPEGRANKDGVCNSLELCLYFWQNRKAPGAAGTASAKLDLHFADANFLGDVFLNGSGNGVTANNNARSYLSTETSMYWRVWDGANYTGTQILCIAPGDRGNFANSLWDKASSANYNSTPC